jgi:DNA-binding MarR family transcriptional regulator
MIASAQTSNVVREWAKVYMHHSLHDFKHFLNETGLSFTHINILLRLLHTQTIRVSEIGEIMGITNAAASQSVDRLVNMNLVHRSEDTTDRRVKKLELTEVGKKLLEQGIEARSKWMEKVINSLASDQQKMVVSSLIILIDAVLEPGQ